MGEWLRDPQLDQLIRDLNSASGRSREALEEPGFCQDVATPLPLGNVASEAGPFPRSEASGENFHVARPAPTVPPIDSAEVSAQSPLFALLRETVRRGASDLLLIHGEPPGLRLDGRLLRAGGEPIGGTQMGRLLEPHLSPTVLVQLKERGAADFSLRLSLEEGVAPAGKAYRFRVNIHRQRGELAAAIRALPRKIPTLEELNLSPTLADLVSPSRGLVLVCGPTGAGKTSTLAALIGEINRSRRVHVITIEDPIEFEHPSGEALIEQIEIGRDSPSFATALRACMRQDPDVILVGEMRDLETMATALTAAETGHLVLSTLHTHDAAQAIHRIVDVFPAQQQGQIRHQLALSLNAIVCQQLIPRTDGRGRVPATEILLANYGVRNHIRRDTLQNLPTEITLGRRQGMISLENSLAILVRNGVIEADEARIRSGRPDEMESLLRSI